MAAEQAGNLHALQSQGLLRHSATTGISGYRAQAMPQYSSSVMKAHMMSGNVYANGHASTSCSLSILHATPGQVAASSSSVARSSCLPRPVTTASSSAPFQRTASPVKGYVARLPSSANSSLAPAAPCGSLLSTGGQASGSPQPSMTAAARSAPNRHVSPRIVGTQSPPAPGMPAMLGASPSQNIIRRSSCPPPAARSQGPNATSSRVSNISFVAKVLVPEPTSPAIAMRQTTTVQGTTVNALQFMASGLAGTASPPMNAGAVGSTASVSSARSPSVRQPPPGQLPLRSARTTISGALTARGSKTISRVKGGSAVCLNEGAQGLPASPPGSSRRTPPLSSRQTTGGISSRLSTRNNHLDNRRPLSREEMIVSGRLRQTILQGSPRCNTDSAVKLVNEPAYLDRQAFLGEVDSSCASVLTLPGPIVGVNDTESVATNPEVHMIEDNFISDHLADGQSRQSSHELDAGVKDLCNSLISPRSSQTCDAPTDPGGDAPTDPGTDSPRNDPSPSLDCRSEPLPA